MERFLSLKYYFSPIPELNFQYTKITLAVGLILLISSISLSFYRKKYCRDQVLKKVIKKYPGQLRLYGIFVLILLLVREAGIPFLSMRILWVVLIIFFLYSAIKALFTFRKEYNKRTVRAKKQGDLNKYLPKKKK